jgi:hypothetical protein
MQLMLKLLISEVDKKKCICKLITRDGKEIFAV